jgi:hypothetical protein
MHKLGVWLSHQHSPDQQWCRQRARRTAQNMQVSTEDPMRGIAPHAASRPSSLCSNLGAAAAQANMQAPQQAALELCNDAALALLVPLGPFGPLSFLAKVALAFWPQPSQTNLHGHGSTPHVHVWCCCLLCRKPKFDLNKIPGPWKHAYPVVGNILECLRPDFHRWGPTLAQPASAHCGQQHGSLAVYIASCERALKSARWLVSMVLQPHQSSESCGQQLAHPSRCIA